MPEAPDPIMAVYCAGDFEQAIALQRARLQELRKSGSDRPDDHLRLGGFLWALGRFQEARDALVEADRLFPNVPSLLENLGVLHWRMNDLSSARLYHGRALAAGSQSPNVLDGLCDALCGLGETERGLQYGRQSLEKKDQLFGSGSPLATIPAGPPPPFESTRRQENVISYGLWGADPRYLVPLQENLRLAKHLFPAWVVRIHADASVPAEFKTAAELDGAQWRVVQLQPGEPVFRKLLWRFGVVSDPAVKRFLIRDADSLLTVKERVAVDDWLGSPKYFHTMRDFRTHTDLLLAGLWGGVGGILPAVESWLKSFRPWRVENNHVDQDLLSGVVWPTVRNSCLIHDSVFTGCLGSVPFPPYGALPANQHVGQNAFMHFRQRRVP